MDPAVKQQIVERVKQATNILVTVSTDPSVDQLAACIGTTLLLNKMQKHATAVFSGQVPSTIEFLQPEKTIETNTDSLRDFIISLDKSKADKLRYKVEDQVVRIFITPYRTSISEKDLVFSQGDFNVEVVLALGVKDRTQLDAAITTHGRILHDATVVSLSTGNGPGPELGQLNWHDSAASSLCEMVVSLSQDLGTNLIDNQMATAFLTGIVAETERFSNNKTSPGVMTISAQLMAAGANQQLIVSKLEPPPPPPSTDQPPPPKPPEAPSPKKPPEGTLSISHEPEGSDGLEVQIKPGEIQIDEQGNIVGGEEPGQKTKSSAAGAPQTASAPHKVEEPKKAEAPPVEPQPAPPAPPPEPIQKTEEDSSKSPKIKRASPALPGPHTLLNPTDHQPSISPPFTADTQPGWYDHDPENSVPVDPLSEKPRPSDAVMTRSPAVSPPSPHTLAKLAIPAPSAPSSPGPASYAPPPTVDSARSAVDNAIAAVPFDPIEHPLASLNAQPLSQELHGAPQTSPASPKGPPATAASLAVPVLASSVPMEPPKPMSAVAKTPPPPLPPPIMPNSLAIPASPPPSQSS